MSDLLIITEEQVLRVIGASPEVVRVVSTPEILKITDASASAVAAGALLVVNRLSEFSTEQAKVDARTNLGLQIIDAGTFN